MKPTRLIHRLLHIPPRVLYAAGLGPLYGRFVLLLTTTGRKSGLPRVTPLQYELIEGVYYVAAARGLKSDWVRNLRRDPCVTLRVKSLRVEGQAELISDPGRIADFIEYRLSRHPRMVGAILRLDGLPSRPTREQLEGYAANLALVAIHPLDTRK